MTLAPNHHKSRGYLDAIRQAETETRSWLPGAIESTAVTFRTLPSEVMGRGREARVANARHVIYWLLREAGLSYPAIGRVVGRDHSTVLSGIRKVEADPALSLTAHRLAGAHVPTQKAGATR